MILIFLRVEEFLGFESRLKDFTSPGDAQMMINHFPSIGTIGWN